MINGEGLKRLSSLEYFLEAINPYHIGYEKGKAMFRFWALGVDSYGFTMSFSEFVHKKVTDGTSLETGFEGGAVRQIEYYDDNARKEYRLMPSGKQVLKADGQAIKGDTIYALSSTQEWYGGSKNGPVHHSSFLEGRPVICAGHLYADDSGKLIGIDNNSGHYAPNNPDLKNAVRVLQSQMDVSDVRVGSHNKTGGMSVAQFLSS